MSFETLSLADVQMEDRKFEQIPVGKYVFQLLPTAEVKVNKFGTEELHLSASVADGDYKGRRVFWKYLDPASLNKDGKPNAWAAQAMKKLEHVIGVDSEVGETPLDYFNRVAQTGNAVFAANYAPNRKKPYIPEGQTEARNELDYFSVEAAAL
jgi:hypothetical protein